MTRTTYSTAVLAVACLSLTFNVPAGAEAAPTQMLKLDQVALFKNGLGFFVGHATCPDDETAFRIALPAAPAHGTLWISYPADIQLNHVVARTVESSEKLDAETIPQLLQANVGQKVTLTLDNKEVTGVITDVVLNYSESSPAAVTYSVSSPARWIPRAQIDGTRQPLRSGLLTLRTETGTLCADPRAASNVTFAGFDVERRFTPRNKVAELMVRLNRPAPGNKIAVTFLAKGVTWAPSYMVDISDETRARLSAKTVIVNDACNLSDVEVQLITGFPHLQFADVVSPMAMQGNLAQFLQSLSRRPYEWGQPAVTRNVMYQSVAYSGPAGGAPTPEYGAAELGATAEDLFFYPAGRIDLGRRESAYKPLFTELVPYEHVYQWDIPDYVNEQDRYSPNWHQEDAREAEQEVWHSLRLTNTTHTPWTTAPGETVKDRVILGQDTLKYTPPGGKTTLRITRAVNVKADQVEYETDRKRDARRWHGRTYDLVTIRGELSVMNALDKAITLEITKTFSGEVKSAEPDAAEEKLARGLRHVNPLTKLAWTIELAPGAEENLSYVYEVYI